MKTLPRTEFRVLRRIVFITRTSMAALILMAAISAIIVGCSSQADVASKNLSKDAEEFKVLRRIVFINGITDNYLLEVQGYCSVEFLPNKFEVTCRTGRTEDGLPIFKKHYMGRSDNAFPVIEQLDGANVSTSHYKVFFRPSAIIPDIDLK
jgi:hypothetical protein